MATRKSFLFLGVSPPMTTSGGPQFEFEESDVWNNNTTTTDTTNVSEAIASSDATRRSSIPNSRSAAKKSSSVKAKGMDRPASLPVNIPDWSKILGGEYKDHRRDSDDDEEYEDDGRVPPHVYLARTRVASLSVHEGIGRTLKGRDLSRVRNAIWKQTGFED